MNFPRITQLSSTIQSLSFVNLHCDLNDLTHLLTYTPAIKELNQKVECNFPNEQLRVTYLPLTSLNLIFEGSKYSLESLLQKLPCLNSLTVQLIGIYLNGYEWEHILTNYLMNIKTFRFKADFTHLGEQNIHELIISFGNSFWIDMHQWFVRCDWNSFKALLYTLPYTFPEFIYDKRDHSMSTCKNENDRVYNCHANKLIIETNLHPLYSIYLNNIHYLDLSCSFNQNIWLSLSNMKQLKTIGIIIQNDDFSYDLFEQFIIQARHLYSLKIKSYHEFPMKLFQMKTFSLPQLDLIGNTSWHVRYCSEIECTAIFNSLLGQKCQCLSINFANRLDILRCLNTMVHLQSLIMRCKNEQNVDDFHRWIKNEVSLPCMISRDPRDLSIYRLWLNK